MAGTREEQKRRCEEVLRAQSQLMLEMASVHNNHSTTQDYQQLKSRKLALYRDLEQVWNALFSMPTHNTSLAPRAQTSLRREKGRDGAD